MPWGKYPPRKGRSFGDFRKQKGAWRCFGGITIQNTAKMGSLVVAHLIWCTNGEWAYLFRHTMYILRCLVHTEDFIQCNKGAEGRAIYI